MYLRVPKRREIVGISWVEERVLPVPVAARSKAGVCGLSLAGIAGSNPAGGMDACLLWVLCVFRWRSQRRADHSSRGFLPSVVCLSVIVKPRYWGGPGPLGAVAPLGGKKPSFSFVKSISKFLLFHYFDGYRDYFRRGGIVSCITDQVMIRWFRNTELIFSVESRPRFYEKLTVQPSPISFLSLPLPPDISSCASFPSLSWRHWTILVLVSVSLKACLSVKKSNDSLPAKSAWFIKRTRFITYSCVMLRDLCYTIRFLHRLRTACMLRMFRV